MVPTLRQTVLVFPVLVRERVSVTKIAPCFGMQAAGTVFVRMLPRGRGLSRLARDDLFYRVRPMLTIQRLRTLRRVVIVRVVVSLCLRCRLQWKDRVTGVHLLVTVRVVVAVELRLFDNRITVPGAGVPGDATVIESLRIRVPEGQCVIVDVLKYS